MGNIIEIEKLSKKYKNENGYVDALVDINLNIKQGEYLSIIGSSGCGKSTLLKIIAGLETEYEEVLNLMVQILLNRQEKEVSYFRITDCFHG